MTAESRIEEDVPQAEENEGEQECPPPPAPPEPRRWRPASEPTCCGSGCIDCPF